VTEVEFLWDVASPYTYLAYTQLDAVAARTGASIRWSPVLIGGLFKGTGNDMPAAVPAKAVYMGLDLSRWRSHYGVSMKLPGSELPFPLRSLLPMRVAVLAEREGRQRPVADCLMRTYWVEGRDLADRDTLAGALAEVGWGADALSAAEAPDIKGELRQRTEAAVARGVFGLPSLFVGDELYFGNDRLPWVEAALMAANRADA
jgi:2-hydroxychromene-2-carboxylate isomerase